MARTEDHSKDIESGQPLRYNLIARKPNRKGLAAIYRQEIIRDIALFTSQGAASFYDKLFASLDFELPRAKTGRTGFPKEAMLCAAIVMKCEGFGYIDECTFIGDKAYDEKHVYNTVKDLYRGDAVIPLNKRNTKDPARFPSGHPLCEAGLAMHKDCKTRSEGRLRQKFCCPFRNSKSGQCPCSHKNWNNGKKNRGCTKYKTIPDDYRLSIDRECLRFKRVYALRSECERYNSHFKASGQERLWVRNAVSAANLNTIAHIAALTVAYAAVVTGSHHSYRSAKTMRRAG